MRHYLWRNLLHQDEPSPKQHWPNTAAYSSICPRILNVKCPFSLPNIPNCSLVPLFPIGNCLQLENCTSRNPSSIGTYQVWPCGSFFYSVKRTLLSSTFINKDNVLPENIQATSKFKLGLRSLIPTKYLNCKAT